jgi:hypothetical protein
VQGPTFLERELGEDFVCCRGEDLLTSLGQHHAQRRCEHCAIARPGALFAVVTGGAVGEPARARLRVQAAAKDAVLVTASIGHEDPKTHITEHVIPKLIAAQRKLD